MSLILQTNWTANSGSPYHSGLYPNGNRPSGGDVGERYFAATPVAGFGGVIMFESHIIRKSATGGTVDVWIGRWGGNSGEITITWDMQDGSRSIASSVDGYAGLNKSIVFASGEYAWKRVQIPLQTWTLQDWEHIVFRITDVTIDNAEPFYRSAYDECFIRIDDQTIVNTGRLFCDLDEGDDSTGDGSQGNPYAGIQKLLDEMVSQGKSGYLIAADGGAAYSETNVISGASIAGHPIPAIREPHRG